MSDKYVLDADGNPQECGDLATWGKFMENRDARRVGLEMIEGVKVSTVFLGVDHSWDGPPPLVWESMVFGGPLDQEQERCSGNKANAIVMHAAMVAKVKESQVKTESAQ